ncbi:hypothetical protein [Aquisalinus flavus]|uniref:hypothetical protein n=1 Tax=Aquisalinus flavus TaxID=1526572 RepID=UPI00165EC9C8|nr:hypothetical protein [Aquisalinus flavus]MBD0426647.1 hypothetical protein [Aquisalinus flavus]UNE47811.1 hypothetical protein FF099_06980 [Aquisalinus flavus]
MEIPFLFQLLAFIISVGLAVLIFVTIERNATLAEFLGGFVIWASGAGFFWFWIWFCQPSLDIRLGNEWAPVLVTLPMLLIPMTRSLKLCSVPVVGGWVRQYRIAMLERSIRQEERALENKRKALQDLSEMA